VCMITIRVKEVAEGRGITTAYQLQKRLNIAPNVAARLWKGEFERIDKTTLDRLCSALECTACDLLVHDLDKSSRPPKPKDEKASKVRKKGGKK
jgi:DNA-binding Xre family transcriptional regulator